MKISRYSRSPKIDWHGDHSAWRATSFSWGPRWGVLESEHRAMTPKLERRRQRMNCLDGLRGPASFSTQSQGDVRERLPWVALAVAILNPDVDMTKLHEELKSALNTDDRTRALRGYGRNRRAKEEAS